MDLDAYFIEDDGDLVCSRQHPNEIAKGWKRVAVPTPHTLSQTVAAATRHEWEAHRPPLTPVDVYRGFVVPASQRNRWRVGGSDSP